MNGLQYQEFLGNPSVFTEHASFVLHRNFSGLQFDEQDRNSPSAVLFLLGMTPENHAVPSVPCVILNKRSRFVRQPGDLCCPGGGISYKTDRWLAFLSMITGYPLKQWKYWRRRKKEFAQETRHLTLLLSAGLREGFEEMRLNPFGIRFLGALPVQNLVMFHRKIYPLAVWVNRQNRFFPNREVEKVVWIPLQYLLDQKNYARYCIETDSDAPELRRRNRLEYPCFLYKTSQDNELLWGATYRITLSFLELVFGFTPPESHSLPKISGILDMNYLTGRKL